MEKLLEEYEGKLPKKVIDDIRGYLGELNKTQLKKVLEKAVE